MSILDQFNQPLKQGWFKHWRKDSSGQTLIMSAFLIPVLLGFLGLALDVGQVYWVKRRMQTAADSGALGGANELWRVSSDDIVAFGAKHDVSLNGFNDTNATVTVNHPPLSGPRAGDDGFVEVIVSQRVSTALMRALYGQTVTVRARAVAGLVNAASPCVMALNPTAEKTLVVQGTSTLSASCEVMVNSTSDRALTANGGGCLSGSEIGVSGSSVSNGSADCVNPTPITNVPRALDPLAYKAEFAPDPSLISSVYTDTKITGGTVTLSPGIYQGSPKYDTYGVLTGYKPAIQIGGGTVTFSPGVYILDSGMKITGNPVITGAGVTFYNMNSRDAAYWNDIDMAGTAQINISAPTSGDLAGILIWDNSFGSTPGSVINGTSNSTFVGAIYAPHAHITWAGTNGTADWTMIIADTVTVSGNAVVGSNYAGGSVPVPTRKPMIVE